MKKILMLLLTCLLCGAFIFTGCSNPGQEKTDGTAETETTEADSTKDSAEEAQAGAAQAEAEASQAGAAQAEAEAAQAEVSQEDIEENIIGTWMIAERDGKPALTNEKAVFTFPSLTKVYISAALDSRPDADGMWADLLEADVDIKGSKVTITWPLDDDTTMSDELSFSRFSDKENQGNLIVKSIKDGKETLISEGPIRLVKINDDYKKDILGTWEGHCTSEGSVFDDGQEHRWEYKDDGTYVYYVKKGNDWVPDGDSLNEYFVAGSLLCTRWIEGDKENREWWEISIDGDKMKWTALREDEDGKTFTAEFEMTRVEK